MSEPTSTFDRAGAILFAVTFVACSALLLSQLPVETRFTSGKQLFAQPRFWPAASIGGMLLFGSFHFLSCWRSRRATTASELASHQHSTTTEVLTWLRAVEYLAWFMVYVLAVPVIGYLPATVLFMLLLTLRQGYRSRAYLLSATLCGACIVLLFKTALAVKIPGGALYEFLPGALRNFLITNF